MAMNPKIFVIGLDGATWRLLKPLFWQNKLPFLQSQVKTGASGTLHSTVPAISAPAWASFQTGLNPGKHNIYNFFKRRTEKMDQPIIDSRDIHGKKLWQYLKDHNKRSLLINMPLSYPLSPVNGVITSSFLTPKNARYYYPNSIKPVLEKYDYQIDVQVAGSWGELPKESVSPKKAQEIVKQVKQVCQKRVNTFNHLANENTYDFYFLYFKSTDFMQHFSYDQPELTQFWQFLDQQIQTSYELLKQKHQDSLYTLIISDHGFHPTATKSWSPYHWLNQELAHDPNNALHSHRKSLWHHLNQLNKRVKQFGVNPAKLPGIKHIRHTLLKQAEQQQLKHDALKKGYLPTIEGLYLFNQYRNPTTINQLTHAAKQATWQDTPIFQFVKPTREVYQGAYLENGPDITWIPNEPFTLNFSPLAKKQVIDRPTHLRGEHFADGQGIFIFNGPGIKPQTHFSIPPHLEKPLNPIPTITDSMPTILALYNIPLSENLDGKPLTQLFENKHPIHQFQTTKDSSQLINQIDI